MSEFQREIYFVHHAQEAVVGDGLSVLGERQAEDLSEQLKLKTLGETALILSSSEPPAKLTAEIIAVRTGIEMVSSRLFHTAGIFPNTIRNLGHLLNVAAGRLNQPRIEEADLVIVTHDPLIKAIMGDEIDRVEQGKVYEYPLFGWENKNFVPHESRLLDLREPGNGMFSNR